MMLLKFLDSLFIESGFEVVDVNILDIRYNYSVYRHKNGDHYIVIEKETFSENDINLLLEKDINTINEIAEKVFTGEYHKNTTLIVCVNSFDIASADMVKIFEEDKYVYKKNMLFYSENELIELHKLFNNVYTLSNANKLLFEQFNKVKEIKDSAIKLLARIFIKLPFLSVEIESINIDDLSLAIQKEAVEMELSYLYNLVSSENFSPSLIGDCDDLVKLELINLGVKNV